VVVVVAAAVDNNFLITFFPFYMQVIGQNIPSLFS